MIYTDKTRLAMRICYDKHHGQSDKSGVPYVFHPLHVAEQMDDEDSTIVALLHDVVEDTAMELEDLRAEGFSETVLEAISLLTHDKSVPYMDYIRAIRQNPLATKVKLADLAHNSDPARLPHQPTEQDLARLAKYAESRRILEGPEESQ